LVPKPFKIYFKYNKIKLFNWEETFSFKFALKQ